MLRRTPFGIGKCLLVLVCIIGFSNPSFGDDKKKKKQSDPNALYFNGNSFELQEMPSMVTAEDGGSVQRMPIKINGEPIYTYKDVNRPPVFMDASVTDFKNMVGEKMQESFTRFKDGTYLLDLGQVIIDGKGEIVYYEPHVMVPEELVADDATQELAKRIKEKAGTVLDKFPSFTPAEKDGKKVAFYLTKSFSGPYKFVVTNRKVEYVK